MAAPGLTLEERERVKRQLAARATFGAEPTSSMSSTRFEQVEQQMLIDRLLSSDSATDFFRQPPFNLTEHAAPRTVGACW